MPMHLTVEWTRPLKLRHSDKHIYWCDETEEIPKSPGVYIFAVMKRSGKLVPVYVGQAHNVYTRVRNHMSDHRSLMRRIKKAPSGTRVVMGGKLRRGSGVQVKRSLDLIEDQLISKFLGEGYKLANVSCTGRPHHILTFRGNSTTLTLTPECIWVRA